TAGDSPKLPAAAALTEILATLNALQLAPDTTAQILAACSPRCCVARTWTHRRPRCELTARARGSGRGGDPGEPCGRSRGAPRRGSAGDTSGTPPPRPAIARCPRSPRRPPTPPAPPQGSQKAPKAGPPARGDRAQGARQGTPKGGAQGAA